MWASAHHRKPTPAEFVDHETMNPGDRMRRMIPMALCCLLCAQLPAHAGQDANAAGPAQSGQFHPPQTAAEKALDNILRLSIASDGNLDAFVLKEPSYNPKKDTGYAKLFTPALLATMAKLQADMVKKDCGGKYKKGELCGFDMSPTLCGQDYPNHYIYRTENQTDSDVAITSVWPESTDDKATYHLISQNGRWVVDGIHCPEMDGFNMK
jgi:hypothetical protein